MNECSQCIRFALDSPVWAVGGLERLGALVHPNGQALSLCLSTLLSPTRMRTVAGTYCTRPDAWQSPCVLEPQFYHSTAQKGRPTCGGPPCVDRGTQPLDKPTRLEFATCSLYSRFYMRRSIPTTVSMCKSSKTVLFLEFGFNGSGN